MAQMNHNPYQLPQRTLSGLSAFATPDYNVQLLNNDKYLETKTGDHRKPVIYGKTRLGGTLIFQDLIGENKDYLIRVYSIAEGEINGVDKIYIDAVESTSTLFDATLTQINGKKVKVFKWPYEKVSDYTPAYQKLFDVLGTVSGGKQRVVYTQVSTGRTDYTKTPLSIAKLSPKWDDTFLGNATAAVAVVYDLSAFENEPKVEFTVSGVNVLNLKTNKKEPSSNPVYCLYDYLTNERYGNGMDPSVINIQSFIDQATLCDQLIDVQTGENLEANTSAKTKITKSSSTVGGTVINIGPSRFQSRGRVNYYRGQLVNEGYDVVGLKATNSTAENTKSGTGFTQQIVSDPAFQIKDPILLINTLSFKKGGFSSGGDYYNYAIIINAKGEYVAVIAYDGSDVEVTVELAVKNKPAGDTVSEKRFTLNGIIDQEDTIEKNINNMLAEMNARLFEFDGLTCLKCSVPSTAVKVFDYESIQGSIDYEFGNQEAKYNGVQATYRDPNFGYKDQTVVVVDNTYNGGDSNSKNFNEMKLNFCDSYGRAHYLASMFLNKSKLQDSIKFTAYHTGIQYAVGDVIRVNDVNKNIDRVYTIEDKNINCSDKTVTFNCLIYDANIFKAMQLTIPYQPNIPVTPPRKITVDTFNAKQVAFDSVGTVDLTWLCNTTGSGLVDHYTIEYKDSTDNGVGYTHLATVTSNSYRVNNLRSGAYTFRIRAFNKLETIASEYVTVQLTISTDIVVLPAVTALKSVFNGVDFEASWDDTRIKPFTSASSPSSVGEKYARYISGYQVKVFKGTTLRRTEIVTDPRYVYSLEKNIQDGKSRDIKIEVRTVNQVGAVSTTSASTQAANTQMTVPVNLVIKAEYDIFYLSTFKPVENDYSGTQVHASKTKDFTPSPATLISDGQNNFSGTLEVGTWYFKVAHYDVFDSLNLVYASASVVLTEITLADIDVDGIIAGIEKGLKDEATERAKADALEITARANAITAETNARAAALAKEAKDRGTAIKSETDQRVAADTALTTRMDSMTSVIDDNSSSIITEASTRATADTAIGKRVDAVVSETGNNTANITSLSKTVTDNNTAMSTRVDTVQATAKKQAEDAETNAKAFATASVTTEKNARVDADTALSTSVQNVTAKTDKNTSDITSVNVALTALDKSTASRVTNMETSLKADSATKANTAEANAKVAAAADAKAKADAALAAAKTDASGKANTAEANAKVAAAADAKAKADKALADAKAYADSIAGDHTYTDAKFKESVDLITTKDTAQSKARTDMEATLKTDSTTKANAARDAALKDLNSRSNLIQKYLPNWKLGAHPADCGWGMNGDANENRFALGDDPYNTKSVMWEMNTNSTDGTGGDGGIGGAVFDCDSKKSYRFSIYVNRSILNGTTYLGCSADSTNNLNGAANTNPYFWNGMLPLANKWYLIVGVLQADSATTDSGISGLYDCETGAKVASGVDFKIKAGAVQQYLRAYLYYANNPQAKQYFWAPRVDVIDGNEPSLTSLMPMVAMNALTNANNAQTYATAKYNELSQTIVTKDSAQTSRVTQMEATLKTDSTNKANAAEANAKVAAATDAKNKADAALAAAKTDASGKANTAEANAKVAAATDAAAKANTALADAKAYADTKITGTTSYTDAKFKEATDLTITKDTAIGQRVTSLTTVVDKTTASVNTLATSVNGLKAEYTIKVNASGHVSGIGLSSGPMGSAFIAQADRIVLANSAGGGGVTPFKLVNNTVYMNEAVIQNASISFAKIANDMQSTNYQPNTTGWQLTKEGKLYAVDAEVSGSITGSIITGSFLEGSVVFGVSGFLTATTYDQGRGVRYGGYENYGINKSYTSLSTPWVTFYIASYDYIGDGVNTISTNPPTQIAANYNRCMNQNCHMNGWFDGINAAQAAGPCTPNTLNKIIVTMQVSTFDENEKKTILPIVEIANNEVRHATYPRSFPIGRNGATGQIFYEPGIVNGVNTIKTLYITFDKISFRYLKAKSFIVKFNIEVNDLNVTHRSALNVRADDFKI